MKADYSRFRFNLKKGYTRVLLQQGRVTLDADWNEHVSIQADLDRKRLRDVIGDCGAHWSANDDNFFISPSESPFDFKIKAGTIYVAGHRIQLDQQEKYTTQPFFPDPPAISDPGENSRTDLVYLCVWERQVTYLEDDAIREIALGGPDTTTRVQPLWQVCVEEDAALQRCEEDADVLIKKAGVGAGLLSVIKYQADSEDDNPCGTPVDSGYRGSENRLYRVEVHQGGAVSGGAIPDDTIAGPGGTTPDDMHPDDTTIISGLTLDNTLTGGASIKWSRYNGAVAFKVLDINTGSRTLTLARLGWDQIVTLKPNSWIELISEKDELAGLPGYMLQIAADAGAINDAQRQVTLRNANGIEDVLDAYDPENDNVKVRLWDTGAIVLKEHFNAETGAYEIVLENGIGIEIRVDDSNDIFRTGDYWTFTARAIQGRIEELIDEPPQGPKRHCCKLALIHWNPEAGVPCEIEDCRPLFPALTEMLQLHYVGGDGQEGMPGDILPGELMVRVSRGEHPAENVPVIFKTTNRGGRVFTDTTPTADITIKIYTDAEGLAECKWKLGTNRSVYHQSVEAYIDAPGDARRHQQVRFNANLSLAKKVSYLPPKDCINIDPRKKTVADALDDLCTIGANGVLYTPPKKCPNIDDTTTNVAEALDALCSIGADGVTYKPPGDCPNLENASNVAEALNKLCSITGTAEDDPAFHVTGVFWLNEEKKVPAIHDQAVPLNQLIRGLRIECDGIPDDPKVIWQESVTQASVFMTLELPSKTLLGARMSYIIDGNPEVEGNNILWKPTDQAVQFLTKEIWRIVGAGGKVVARLFLKGSKIYGTSEKYPDKILHLDGDVVNYPNNEADGYPHNLMLPSGDGEEGGTFEMWFNLEISDYGIYVVGLLHPDGFIGFRETVLRDNDSIILKKIPAINLRLNALDLCYDHLKVIEEASLTDYPFSGTLYNEEPASLSLTKSGFDTNTGFYSFYTLVQKEYSNLAQVIMKEWDQILCQDGPFKELHFDHNLWVHSKDEIPKFLEDAFSRESDEIKLPSILICDHTVLNNLRKQKLIGEPDGIIRRPFYRRI